MRLRALVLPKSGGMRLAHKNQHLEAHLCASRIAKSYNANFCARAIDIDFYYSGSTEGHEYPDLQVGDEVNPRPDLTGRYNRN